MKRDNIKIYAIIFVIILSLGSCWGYSIYNKNKEQKEKEERLKQGLYNNNITGIDEIKFGIPKQVLINYFTRKERCKYFSSYSNIIEATHIFLLGHIWEKAVFFFSEDGLYKIEIMPTDPYNDKYIINNLYVEGSDETVPNIGIFNQLYGVWQDTKNKSIIYFGTSKLVKENGDDYGISLIIWKYGK